MANNMLKAFTAVKSTSKAGKLYYKGPQFGDCNLVGFVSENGNIVFNWSPREERSKDQPSGQPRAQVSAPRPVSAPSRPSRSFAHAPPQQSIPDWHNDPSDPGPEF
jgi:hypothetical protein